MKSVLVILGILVAVVIAVAVYATGIYNKLVERSQAVDAQWAQVQNVYQRRADLVPNLVSTVTGAANFEKSTLTEVTNARASVGRVQINSGSAPTDPAQLAEFDRAQSQLGSALSRLLVVAENYPTLTATTGFRDLQAQLEGTENRIAVERGRFNDLARDYNTAVKRMPTALFAGIFGFKEKAYFTATPGSDRPPEVQFGDFSQPAPVKP
jgi:LemA protein